MKAVGLDPENPDFSGWAEKRFERVNGGEVELKNDDDSAIPELVMMAGFLERRGLHEKLSDAFSKPFAEYAKHKENDFLNLLGTLFEVEFGAPHFASDQATEWAGEDEGRWSEVFSTALGEDDEVLEWQNWIREIKPEITHREVLDVMLALFQNTTTPGNLRSEWLDRAWDIVGKTENKKLKDVYVKRILARSINYQDVRNTLRAWDMLEPEDRALPILASIDTYLSAQGRWKEAAEVLNKATNNRSSSSPERHAYLAVNLRRAGLEEQARVHDDWADKLALGDALSCARIGACYAYAGDFERAAKWQKRAALLVDISGGDFVAILDNYAASMLRVGNWKVAASCYEALVQIYASQKYIDGSFTVFARARLSADLAKAMEILPKERERALKMLDGIHRNFVTDGSLADDFFPLLRKAGLLEELDLWFDESWKRIAAVIEKYPESHNARNTAAWFASRAGLKLDEAEEFLKGALELSPNQPAYLDTMAELKFAQGNRKAAVKWSNRAVECSPFDEMIRMQNERFKNGKLPQK